MGRDRMKDDELLRLANALAEDILDMTPEELDAELRAIGEDPDTVEKEMRAVIGKSIMQSAKARLAVSKVLANPERGSSRISGPAPGAARRKLDKIISQNVDAYPQLTLAARKGETMSDADAESLLEDLRALGIVDKDEDMP